MGVDTQILLQEAGDDTDLESYRFSAAVQARPYKMMKKKLGPAHFKAPIAYHVGVLVGDIFWEVAGQGALVIKHNYVHVEKDRDLREYWESSIHGTTTLSDMEIATHTMEWLDQCPHYSVLSTVPTYGNCQDYVESLTKKLAHAPADDSVQNGYLDTTQVEDVINFTLDAATHGPVWAAGKVIVEKIFE